MVDIEHVVKIVKGLTEEGCFTTAISEGALLLGFIRLYQQATLLKQLQDIEGCIPEELLGYRERLRNRLFQAAQAKLNPAEYDALCNAYDSEAFHQI